jgi:retinol dehydrogenase 14
VTANALHPALTRTAFGAEDPAGTQRRLVPLLRPFMYFVNRKAKRSSKASYDEATAARLWRVSAVLVGLTAAAEPPLNHHA